MLAHSTFSRDIRDCLVFPERTRWRPDFSGRRSKSLLCGRSRAGIVGLNPTGGVDVCFLWLSCFVSLRSLRWANHSSIGVLPSVVYLSVIVKFRPWEDPGPLGGGNAMNKSVYVYMKQDGGRVKLQTNPSTRRLMCCQRDRISPYYSGPQFRIFTRRSGIHNLIICGAIKPEGHSWKPAIQTIFTSIFEAT